MKSFKLNSLYLGDKNVDKVSGVWKCLHISIYIAIAITAFISSMAAGNMFQTFKYNCILFCSEIVFETETIQADVWNKKDTETKPNDFGAQSNNNDTFVENDLETNTTNSNLANTTDVLENVTTIPVKDSSKTETEKTNNTIIFKNHTHVFRNQEDSVVLTFAKIDVKKSRFASNFSCNFVLGVALVTFIFAAFCAILLAMCSKGGSGSTNNTLKKPQNVVYPILFSSIILGLINLITTILLKNGIRDFCENFELFTQEKRCTSLINKFTIHERQENFYLPYFVLSHTFDLIIVFFVCQVIVTVLRIIYAVDYQLYTLECEDNEEEKEFEIEDGHMRERRL